MPLGSRLMPLTRFAPASVTAPTTARKGTSAISRFSVISSHVRPTNASPRNAHSSAFSTVSSRMAPPSTMRAVAVHETGGPEALKYEEAFQVPQPKDGEVLVKNKLAGINYIDTYFRTGLYPSPSGYPLVVGREGVGTVVATKGDTQGVKEGDEVVYLAPGGYADYTAVTADKAVQIPKGLNDEDVLGSWLMGLTALYLVQESYAVKKGDHILVHAAAGGVGLLLCQLLKDLGATVIGTASTKEKCDLAKKNGADHMINYAETSDWPSEVKKIVPDGVICVYDGVGKSTWEGSLSVVRRKGSVIFFGNASGPPPPIDLALLSKTNVKIQRPTLFNYVSTRSELDHYATDLFKYLQAGKLKVKVHKTYELNQAEQAHRDLEGRGTTGKLLIKL